MYHDCQRNHILPLVLYNMSNIVTVWLPQKSQMMNHWLQDVKQWHAVTVRLPAKPQTTKCWLQHVPHTQLQSGYQWNHRPQRIAYNMSHIVTVWLPVKSQTTKCCLQHVPHSYHLATKQTTDHTGLSTTCLKQLQKDKHFRSYGRNRNRHIWYSRNSHILI